MILRKFCSGDVKSITTLFYQTVHSVNIKDYSIEQCNVWAPNTDTQQSWVARLDQAICYVAEIHSKIVGFGSLTLSGHLDMLYVNADYVKRGIGKSILKQLESDAKKLGLNEITTESSITAKPFFEKNGYTIIETRNKIHADMTFLVYIMSKKI
jgi:putative acetyltransferase